MDNSQSSELTREMLLKVLTGDRVSPSVMHALRQHSLIRIREDAQERTGLDTWLERPVTDFKLTAKGLARLQGDKNGI